MRCGILLLIVVGVVAGEEKQIQVEDVANFIFPTYGHGYIPGSYELPCEKFNYQAPDSDICLSDSGNKFSTFTNCGFAKCDMEISVAEEEDIVLLLNYSRIGYQCKARGADCSSAPNEEQGSGESEEPNSNQFEDTNSPSKNPVEEEANTSETEFSVSLGAQEDESTESGDGGSNPTEEESRTSEAEFSVSITDNANTENSGDGGNTGNSQVPEEEVAADSSETEFAVRMENDASPNSEESGNGALDEDAVDPGNTEFSVDLANGGDPTEQSGGGEGNDGTQFSVSFGETESSGEGMKPRRRRLRVKRDANDERSCECQTTWCSEKIYTAYQRNGRMYEGDVSVKYPCGCDCRRRQDDQLA